ncbi:Tryptophan synthase alpha chain [uncultured Eubacteriales bacterium]|uniref:Tryptophan synthase alpha chain n=1 Tax=uncultured Eubacteriales bacterium TaxID=172733 RepID=A0A212KBU1_9FIRM|nr:Tryptophan synthase alpha chain [uncultured Eubacteriales bacterium]
MSRIAEAFSRGKAFIPFVTAGDPDLETTEQLVLAMSSAGADIIELGIPFSDPMAEGPVIQAASARALTKGCTADQLFSLVERLRTNIQTPLVFMTYYNPIFSYGAKQFLESCSSCGIDGVIVPDLPFEEKNEFAPLCAAHGIELISLIAPTSKERIRAIAADASGFLYCVSSLGVTGVRAEINTDISEMIGLVREVSTIPCAVGFGISTPAQARQMAALSDGAIVGSAIVRLVAEHGRDCVPVVRDYVAAMKQAIRE